MMKEKKNRSSVKEAENKTKHKLKSINTQSKIKI